MSGLFNLFPGSATAQTSPRGVLIVNEISNGKSGTKEFVELIPAVCEADPTPTIDISSWIIDDNNGIFTSDPVVAGSNLGISSGHIRLKNDSFFQNFPSNRLLVLFNGADFDSTNADFTAASTVDYYDNGTGIFIPVGISNLVEYTTFVPNSTTSTYCAGQTYIVDTPAWNAIGMRNSSLGDGIQTRCPGCGGLNNGEPAFYHGVSYGDTTMAVTTANFIFGAHIAFPANDTNAAGFPIGGTNRTFYFNSGDPGSGADWSYDTAGAATPGATNNLANANYFQDVQDGLVGFDCCAIDTTVVPPDTTATGSNGVLIVTEISNGPSGSCEYIELLVAACGGSDADSVDIRGWIVDDNSGNFNTSRTCGTGLSISTGHLRFAYDDVWKSVPVGSVIVLFNNGTNNCYNFVDDGADSDADGVYFIEVGNNPYVERNTTTPNAAAPANCGYCAGTYAVVTSAWNTVGLSNTADAAQVRCPGCTETNPGSADFYHGIGYGTGFSGFAGSGNLGGAYVSGSGTGKKYEFFQGNEPGLNANWQSSTADAAGTPPASAGQVFAAFRDSVIAGLYVFPCCGEESLGKKSQSSASPFNAGTAKVQVKEGAAVLYPNPAGNVLNLDINRTSGFTVMLVDLTGKLVYNKTYEATQGTSTIQLNLAELPSGVYVYNIVSQGDEETLNGRIVIKK